MARSSEPSRPDEPWIKPVREAEPSFLGLLEPAFSAFSPVNQATFFFFFLFAQLTCGSHATASV